MSGMRPWVKPFWVKTVQTVNVGHPISMFSEYGGQNEESQWLGPKIIGGKVVYPWVY